MSDGLTALWGAYMRFSLITVTTNRLLLTERLFISLAAQTHKDFEIIFVHGKECTAKAHALAAAYSAVLNIKPIASTDQCLSRSRNVALPLATGDIIAFPDDDCVYEPNTLAMCVAAFEQEPRAGVVLADTIDLGQKRPKASGAPKKLGRCSLFSRSVSFVQFHKKECVQTVGVFDEELGIGSPTPWQSGEDTDYVLRAFETGFHIFYAPSIVVRHPAVNLRDELLPVKARGYGQGRMRLLYKHGLPEWFVWTNILHPLLMIPVDCLKEFILIAHYRGRIFNSRLNGRREAR